MNALCKLVHAITIGLKFQHPHFGTCAVRRDQTGTGKCLMHNDYRLASQSFSASALLTF